MGLISEREEIVFEPIKHTYKSLIDGSELLSVSKLIHLWVQDFDSSGEITARCAKKEGITPDEMRAKWQKINDEANIFGTSVHEDIEYYIRNGIIKDNDNKHWVEQFATLKFEGQLFPEERLYCLERKICGTSDLPELLCPIKKTINIWDFKTNKELHKSSKYGNYMLGQFFYIEDCNFNHYTIQLSIYAYLLELKGYTINELNLIYFNRTTMKMEIHPLIYKKEIAKSMIELYNAGKHPKKHVIEG